MRTFFLGLIALAGSVLAFARTADAPAAIGAMAVYHERSADGIFGDPIDCGLFTVPLAPAAGENETIRFETRRLQDSTRPFGVPLSTAVYYTTNGGTPSPGAAGTTFVGGISQCASTDAVGGLNAFRATIPGQATGTLVKYVVSAVYPTATGNREIFANSGSCVVAPGQTDLSTCTATCETIVCATVFSYTAGGGTTAARLRSFSVVRHAAGTLVRWRTASEVDVLGFNIYRAWRGKRVRVNARLLSAANAPNGHSYRYVARSYARPGARFWLQAVDVDGSRTWFGPARLR